MGHRAKINILRWAVFVTLGKREIVRYGKS